MLARERHATLGPTRRSLLRWSALAGATVLLGRDARARGCRSLSLYAVHTGERLHAEYCAGGRYLPDALRAIAGVLRDHEADAVHPIDPRLLDTLARMTALLDTREPLHVVSAYRTPETNARKRRRDPRVAGKSFHVLGRAVDLFVPDRRLASVRHVAMAVRAGGVGYYPGSGFVHVDSGPLRTW